MIKYTFWNSFLTKTAGAILFALPIVAHFLPAGWENVTLGAVVMLITHWLEDKTLV